MSVFRDQREPARGISGALSVAVHLVFFAMLVCDRDLAEQAARAGHRGSLAGPAVRPAQKAAPAPASAASAQDRGEAGSAAAPQGREPRPEPKEIEPPKPDIALQEKLEKERLERQKLEKQKKLEEQKRLEEESWKNRKG